MMKDRGIFTQTFNKEQTLKSTMAKLHYEESVLDNLELHYRRNKKSLLRKRKPPIATLYSIENELDLDACSINTETDGSECIEEDNLSILDEEEEGSENEGKVKVITERIINTTRRADSVVIKMPRTQKNVVTVKKSSPQWVANFRAQESERYKHPLKAWEYTLQDGSTYFKLANQ